jgi:hypothetical protein
MSKQKTTPIPKGLYAWNSLHAGSFLLYTESLKDCHRFLFLPGPTEYYLTKEDFDRCIKNNTLEFVEPLPDEIYQETIDISLACPSPNAKLSCNEISKN